MALHPLPVPRGRLPLSLGGNLDSAAWLELQSHEVHPDQPHQSMGCTLKHQRGVPGDSPTAQTLRDPCPCPTAWDGRVHCPCEQDPHLCTLSTVLDPLTTTSSEQAVKNPQYPVKQQSLLKFLGENSWQLCFGKSQCTSPACDGLSRIDLQKICKCQKSFWMQIWEYFPAHRSAFSRKGKKKQEFVN